MLTFMKDGQNDEESENVETSTLSETLNAEPAVTDDAYLKTAEHGKNLRHSTITLAVIFTIGAFCLWFMIKKAAPQNADAAVTPGEAKIEDVLKKLKDAQMQMNDKMDDVGRFYDFSQVEQISVSELKKNPFEHELAIADLSKMDSAMEAMARAEKLRRSRGLDLEGIMGTSHDHCCMINGKILREGDVIEGFTVKNIDARYVMLESDGIPVTLKMAE